MTKIRDNQPAESLDWCGAAPTQTCQAMAVSGSDANPRSIDQFIASSKASADPAAESPDSVAWQLIGELARRLAKRTYRDE